MVHCWKARYEAMGYADVSDACRDLGEAAHRALVVASGRDPDVPDEQGYYPQFLDVLEDMCMRQDGHDGPCGDWHGEDEVVITFLPHPGAAS